MRKFKTGEDVAGELLYDLSYTDLSETETIWRPYIKYAEVEMAVRGVATDSLPDSRNWDWTGKLVDGGAAPGSAYADWRFFGLGHRGLLQVAIAISTTPQPCRAQDHRGQDAVGIELVATAPWNIKRLMTSLRRTPFLDQIGRALIRVAISYSQAAGCEGRLYLYSVHKAESYYSQVCGMIDLGVEFYHGEALRRFEMTKERAETFLEETS